LKRRGPIVVMGASLGGLEALRTVLSGIPPDFSAPIAIVQHRLPENDARLVEILTRETKLSVCEAEDRSPALAGRVYIAPSGYHLLIDAERFALSCDGPVRSARPSIDVLFESAAASAGESALSVLMTGSNDDGARGTLAVHAAGGTTVVQDPRTAKSPIALEAALSMLRPSHVAELGDVARIVRRWGEARAASQHGSRS
jgi:two-component system, chemotaxis family, protein-glutamate methylesterase/glutaminase